MSRAPLTVGKLSPGAVFRAAGLKFKLVRLSAGSAYVEPMARTRKKIGDAEFDAPGGRTHISLGTECDVIDIFDDDYDTVTITNVQEEDDFMGTKTTTTTNVKAVAKPRDGKRTKPPGTQTRAIKEGTIRHALFIALTGKDAVKTAPALMKRLGMTKSTLLAHVNEFWRAHGWGYSIDGEVITLTKPLKVAIKEKAVAAAPAVAKKPRASKKSAVADPLADDNDDFLS